MPRLSVVGELCAPEPMQRVEPPTGPWQDVALDLMGPLPTGESLLVVVDYYSRFYEVGILRSTTVDKVIDFLGPVFTRYGYPFSVKSDNGPQFVSQVFKDFWSSTELSTEPHRRYGRRLTERLKGRTGLC